MTDGLVVDELRLATDDGERVLDDATLTVAPGEIVGLAGESGSGKTTLGHALLSQYRAGVGLVAGRVLVGGVSITGLSPDDLRRVRGTLISLVAQHPASALNPALRIESQLEAVLRAHGLERRAPDGRDRAVGALESVGLTEDALGRYPHQLSGGQLQRAALAIALVTDPEVLVLDEPTSGLDADAAERVFATVREHTRTRRLAVLCISHDLELLERVTDRVEVMYAGSIVEGGPTAAIVSRPAHPYTQHLLAALPDPTGRESMVALPGLPPDPGRRPSGCQFAPRCDLAVDACRRDLPPLTRVEVRRVRCVRPFAVPASVRDRADPPPSPASPPPAPVAPPDHAHLLDLRDLRASFGRTDVLEGVDLRVGQGEWLAIAGRSGAGKTTLLRALAGLHPHASGHLDLAGEALPIPLQHRSRAQVRAVGLVSQHPTTAFNPRRTIGHAVARPLVLSGVGRRDAARSAREVLAHVGLSDALADRYPRMLSGGELQRAAIARAVVGRPRLLLCDEITSSLDTIVRAGIIELLRRVHDELGIAVVFVSHDLPLVEATADRVAFLDGGRIVGSRPTQRVLSP